jgi:hypothetical protein
MDRNKIEQALDKVTADREPTISEYYTVWVRDTEDSEMRRVGIHPTKQAAIEHRVRLFNSKVYDWTEWKWELFND